MLSSRSPVGRGFMDRPFQAARTVKACATGVLLLVVFPSFVRAQGLERLTFAQAIERAIANNPTIAQATAGIMRAEAVLQQVRSSSLPALGLALTTTVTNPVKFDTVSIVPVVQTQTIPTFSVPILTPVLWAQRNQAGDQVLVSQRSERDVRRQIAVAAAQSYLAIIARRRVFDLNSRARDNARDHFMFANQRFQGGIGSRLNALRAEQEMLSDEIGRASCRERGDEGSR